ncbi:MAG TPA: Na(+)-translocating NADH-quinone reductase subunit C [Porticoccaceae bacterium]|nr:Na(+)-translocating NADH-quinone reductase subunit C [Porticoccaceae bacterium]
MADNDSVRKTLLVTLVLCVVCAVVVSAAAVLLRPQQAANQALNRKANILAAAGLLRPDVDLEEQFKRVETRLVDLDSGRFSTDLDPVTYDQRKASRDPALSAAIPQEQDIAKIQRRPRYAQVYLVKDDDGRLSRVILPVKGYGLWSTMHGFIALEGDLNTVAGLGFYEHAETPGLGGEIDNPRWKALWPGKRVYEGDKLALRVIKGKVDSGRPEAIHQVDGLAGATLTSRGVDNLVRYWLGEQGFASFLANLRAGAA